MTKNTKLYSINQLESIISGKWKISNEDAEIQYIAQDSRKIIDPESTLFFAMRGGRLDGHNYIQNLYLSGVRNFVLSQEEAVAGLSDVNYVVVGDSLRAMQKLAEYHRNKFDIPVIGITGSNGKTIVKEWCHQMLQEDYNICRSPKSYNSQLGVPLSVWSLNIDHTLGIFEAGISEPDEMDKLQKIIRPNIGVFTTIGSAHGENFIHETHKIKEKLKLFLKADFLIYCADLSSVHQNIRQVFGNKSELSSTPTLLSWGQNKESRYQIVEEKREANSTQILLRHNGDISRFKIPFTDVSSIQNAIQCIVLLLHLKYDADIINVRLEKLQRVAMRLEQKAGINHSTIINDSYNSDIDSLRIALDFMQQQKYKQNKTVILSDILQSGMAGVDLYKAVNDLLLQNGVNRFVAIGPHLTSHQAIFKPENYSGGVYFYKESNQFIQQIQEDDYGQETILIKGARSFEFENISAVLEEKAHATVLEIDLNALVHNLKVFQSRLSPNTKLMAMVKAFAYGASAIEVATLLEFHQVDYFAVAYTDEGVALRRAGIKTPIMVLNPEERSFAAIIKYKLEPEIYSFELFHKFSKAVELSDFDGAFPVHIDIDTGMKRLGFESEDIEQLIALCKVDKNLKVVSVFSHLAGSDEEDLDEFTREQIARFKNVSDQFTEVLGGGILRHISNSGGIERFSEANFDMVRLGIGLYGYSSKWQNELQTVTRLKTSVSQIKRVKKGESIGYGRKGRADKDTKIATIAIGYADGLNRLLSNGLGEVYVRGQRVPIVGNICMDMAMIDVGSIPDIKVGDSVEIFGENIPVAELAAKLNTIPYEVFTAVSERVKRVFFVD